MGNLRGWRYHFFFFIDIREILLIQFRSHIVSALFADTRQHLSGFHLVLEIDIGLKQDSIPGGCDPLSISIFLFCLILRRFPIGQLRNRYGVVHRDHLIIVRQSIFVCRPGGIQVQLIVRNQK